jgi:hypothetical protein
MQPALRVPASIDAGGSPPRSTHEEQQLQEHMQQLAQQQLPVHMAHAGAIAHFENEWHPVAPLQQQPGLFLQQGPVEDPAAARYFLPPLLPPSAVEYINQVCQREFCCELHLLPKALRPNLMAQAMQNIYTSIWGE